MICHHRDLWVDGLRALPVVGWIVQGARTSGCGTTSSTLAPTLHSRQKIKRWKPTHSVCAVNAKLFWSADDGR
jgi:hypothetical protein